VEDRLGHHAGPSVKTIKNGEPTDKKFSPHGG